MEVRDKVIIVTGGAPQKVAAQKQH